MNITMIGTGYVGLVSGICFSEFGFPVTCVDLDAGKIDALNQGELPIYEPGLERLMQENIERLSFTTDFDNAVSNADVVFIAVGTPSRRGDGEADLQYVHAAARQIARVMKPNTVIVLKSTVVVGTNTEVRDIIEQERPGVPFSLASNPEFLREGSAIEDFMRPDRVVVGVTDDHAKEVLQKLYRPLYLRDAPIVFTTPANAELIKYAANAFLAMKITFINEVADLCEKTGGDVQQVARAIGLDNRIGGKFLHAGPGFGGSCFPKDTRAFAATGRKYNAPQRLIETVSEVNEARKIQMADKILQALGEQPSGKTVGVLGLAFKPNTDDMREAPSLTIIPILEKAGVQVKAHDPQAVEEATPHLPGTTMCETVDETIGNADVVVILTEWNVYRALDLNHVKKAMRGDTLVDLRNIYPASEPEAAGLRYLSIGR
ncbi:MAG: UDP-glucose/GDP-mannose dehydrogenase family protein [Rhizobiales bacterium]|nr:UDP-glucose/GDP-mannose dehydrogenase family protein [Hyphomicrobiales bacterium]